MAEKDYLREGRHIFSGQKISIYRDYGSGYEFFWNTV
jgi:hypothetical protein